MGTTLQVPQLTDGRAPLLDVQSAAKYLGVSPRHVRYLVAERRIVSHRLGERLTRFSLADLDAYLDQCRVAPRGGAA